ncbi:MAG: hypothetical protein N3A69_15445 [Leptospiraceae bacterium]|nr:hypothetical protein [Leptospiraceae bacterium]
MGCVYRLNSFYEWELESFPKPLTLGTNLKIKSDSLEYLFAPLLKTEDELFLSHKPNAQFLNYLSEHLKKEIPITNQITASKNLVEWGIIHKKKNGVFIYNKEIIAHHKKISSKLEQSSIREKYYPHLPKRFLISKISDLEKLISKLNFPVLLKPNYSLSGVGSFVFQNIDELRSSLKDLELENRTYFLEEWKEKIFDFSALCDSKKGFFCLTKMKVDSKGKYRGSEVFSDARIEKEYAKILEILEKNNFLPEGKFSIDGFAYKQNGQEYYNYISEINPRWTMGWLLIHLKEIFGENIQIEFIRNIFASQNVYDIEKHVLQSFSPTNVLLLSPPEIEGKKLSNLLVMLY